MNIDEAIKDAALDPQDFLGVVERFSEQFEWALDNILEPSMIDAGRIDSIAILGMGGSGISGDIVRATIGPRSRLNVQTVRGYELPGWVGERTLVLAVSHSGNTAETLATFDAAQRCGAQIISIASGGKLAEISGREGLPLVTFPGTYQPRASLGYLSLPQLLICERLGLLDGFTRDLNETLDLVKRRSKEWGRSAPIAENPAKQLAQALVDRLPIIYASDGPGEVAAYRFKCQLNECAKTQSYSVTFPELDHNEIVGWTGPGPRARRDSTVVVFRAEGRPEMVRRVDETLSLMRDGGVDVREVMSEGRSPLARLMDLIYLGDFTATYLALATGVDPTPVAIISELKSRL
ncbi:MAG TPA: bifunctional phosphoglucose/phosphomannose isomerase [Actinomycetota bacterium]|nr:bifunctional phosphoglucose/phosphomannose isomerase [Actinomycetota bacterium]